MTRGDPKRASRSVPDLKDASIGLAIYQGADHVGTIVERAGQHYLFDHHGRHVGRFSLAGDAMGALPVSGGAA